MLSFNKFKGKEHKKTYFANSQTKASIVTLTQDKTPVRQKHHQP